MNANLNQIGEFSSLIESNHNQSQFDSVTVQGWARGNFETLGYTWDIDIGFHFDCDQIDPGLAARFIFKDLTNPGLTGKFIIIDLTNPGLTGKI